MTQPAHHTSSVRGLRQRHPMKKPTLLRITAVASSLTLLAGFVWHSHTTPNLPPPDPLGIRQDGRANHLEALLKTGEPIKTSSTYPMSRYDLRMIGSKSINQPIFSIRRARPGPYSFEFIFSGSEKDSAMPEMPYFIKTGAPPTFDLFGQQPSTRPAP